MKNRKTAEQTVFELLAAHSGLTIEQIKKGNLTLKEWQRLICAAEWLSNLPIFIRTQS